MGQQRPSEQAPVFKNHMEGVHPNIQTSDIKRFFYLFLKAQLHGQHIVVYDTYKGDNTECFGTRSHAFPFQ